MQKILPGVFFKWHLSYFLDLKIDFLVFFIVFEFVCTFLKFLKKQKQT